MIIFRTYPIYPTKLSIEKQILILWIYAFLSANQEQPNPKILAMAIGKLTYYLTNCIVFQQNVDPNFEELLISKLFIIDQQVGNKSKKKNFKRNQWKNPMMNNG